jgi:hypothetical protein
MTARAELKALLCAASFGLALALAAPAWAQSSCENDIGKMQDKRMGLLDSITKMQSKDDGKLDPIAACPKLRALAAHEKEIQSYMEKNQSWCNIPDEALTNIKETQAKTTQIAGQACSLAAQVKKQQQQQQAQGGFPSFSTPAPKLPGGPL